MSGGCGSHQHADGDERIVHPLRGRHGRPQRRLATRLRPRSAPRRRSTSPAAERCRAPAAMACSSASSVRTAAAERSTSAVLAHSCSRRRRRPEHPRAGRGGRIHPCRPGPRLRRPAAEPSTSARAAPSSSPTTGKLRAAVSAWRWGPFSGSSGTVTVSGVGSSITVSSTGAGTATPLINVGNGGDGQMTISDGATVSILGSGERNFTVNAPRPAPASSR